MGGPWPKKAATNSRPSAVSLKVWLRETIIFQMLVCAEYIPHSSPVGGGNTPKCWLPTANQIKEEEVKSALKRRRSPRRPTKAGRNFYNPEIKRVSQITNLNPVFQ